MRARICGFVNNGFLDVAFSHRDCISVQSLLSSSVDSLVRDEGNGARESVMFFSEVSPPNLEAVGKARGPSDLLAEIWLETG